MKKFVMITSIVAIIALLSGNTIKADCHPGHVSSTSHPMPRTHRAPGSVNINYYQGYFFTNFQQNRAEIPQVTRQVIYNLVNQLQVMDFVLMLFGGVSYERITQPTCQVSKTVAPFYLPGIVPKQAGFQTIVGTKNEYGDNITCETRLAQARVKMVERAFRIAGVSADRIIVNNDIAGVPRSDAPHTSNRGVYGVMIPRNQSTNLPPGGFDATCHGCPEATSIQVINVTNIHQYPPNQTPFNPLGPERPPDPTNRPPKWVPVAYMVGGCLVAGGTVYILTETEMMGGQGASGENGQGGDGGDVNFCNENPTACVATACAAGIGLGYISYRAIERPGKIIKKKRRR